MALITCSDCGQSISDRAKFCPHCGCPTPEIVYYECKKTPNHCGLRILSSAWIIEEGTDKHLIPLSSIQQVVNPSIKKNVFWVTVDGVCASGGISLFKKSDSTATSSTYNCIVPSEDVQKVKEAMYRSLFSRDLCNASEDVPEMASEDVNENSNTPQNEVREVFVCPDCGQIITNENEACPNCGCPSNLFKKEER